MHRLVSTSGSLHTWKIPLRTGNYSIGRGADNDVQIEDPSVSTTHCQIVVEQNSIRIFDRHSTNGTFIDNTPVQESNLLPGHLLRLGAVELRLEEDNPDSEPVGVDQTTRVSTALSSPAAARPAGTTTIACPAAPAESSAPSFCKNHYQNLARYQCPKCSRALCDLCVNTRSSTDGGLKFCKSCGTQCVTVALKPILRRIEFFQEIPGALKYPFSGDGLMLLIGGTLFFGFLDAGNWVARHALAFGLRAMMMRVVIFTFILGTGYLFSYLKNVITCTAHGDKNMPDWPEITVWKEDIVSPMFQLVILSVGCFGPTLLVYLWLDVDYPWLVWVVAFMGCFFFPIAFLGVAMFDSLAVLNPLFLVGSILRVPREYAVPALVFAAILGLRWLSETLLSWAMGIPLVPAILSDLLGIGLLIIEARILGLLYLAHKADLGWFQR